MKILWKPDQVPELSGLSDIERQEVMRCFNRKHPNHYTVVVCSVAFGIFGAIGILVSKGTGADLLRIVFPLVGIYPGLIAARVCALQRIRADLSLYLERHAVG